MENFIEVFSLEIKELEISSNQIPVGLFSLDTISYENLIGKKKEISYVDWEQSLVKITCLQFEGKRLKIPFSPISKLINPFKIITNGIIDPRT